MTSSLGNKLPEGETQEVNLCVNNYECKSISRYIRVLFRSQNTDVSDVSEVSL